MGVLLTAHARSLQATQGSSVSTRVLCQVQLPMLRSPLLKSLLVLCPVQVQVPTGSVPRSNVERIFGIIFGITAECPATLGTAKSGWSDGAKTHKCDMSTSVFIHAAGGMQQEAIGAECGKLTVHTSLP